MHCYQTEIRQVMENFLQISVSCSVRNSLLQAVVIKCHYSHNWDITKEDNRKSKMVWITKPNVPSVLILIKEYEAFFTLLGGKCSFVFLIKPPEDATK